MNNWMLNAQNLANPSLVMQYAQYSGACFDWWAEGLGAEFMSTKASLDFWPRTAHTISEIAGQKFWNGTAQFVTEHEDGTYDIHTTEALQIFHSIITSGGGQIDWSTKAAQLVKEGERVVGVIAQNGDGAYVKYSAAKAVVLAAGDFAANEEMRNELCTAIVDLVPPDTMWMGAGRDGSGIQMGVWAGGHVEPRSVATMGGDTSHPGLGVGGDMTGVWLNDQGQRYTNEFFGDPIWSGRPTVQQNLDMIYSLFDAKVIDQLDYNIPAHNRFDWADAGNVQRFRDTLDGAVAAGAEGLEAQDNRIYAADDLATLADYAGMSEEVKQNFLAAVERYNSFCEKGADEDFGKDPRVLWKIDTAPYYLSAGRVKMLAFMLVTVGGLHTDGNQQVLDAQNHAIPGLFATGNCCGKRFGSDYFSPIAGVSVGLANTLGYTLGKHLLTL
jgi:succinate dehydrogenase/fumarate reductase flavoprotein subunit